MNGFSKKNTKTRGKREKEAFSWYLRIPSIRTQLIPRLILSSLRFLIVVVVMFVFGKLFCSFQSTLSMNRMTTNITASEMANWMTSGPPTRVQDAIWQGLNDGYAQLKGNYPNLPENGSSGWYAVFGDAGYSGLVSSLYSAIAPSL